MPVVSVIVNCLNGERYLREALDSVYAQTYQDWEIVLWDNASTDGTATIAQSYDSRLRYFRSVQTVSLGHARNFALREARGELIAFLDSDDVWLPRKLERQVPKFAESHRIGLVFSDATIFNDQGVSYQHYGGKTPPTGMVFRNLLADYFLALETVIVRKAALDSLDHWFDERFNIIEEFDLFVRLGHDWQFALVNETLGKWRIHQDNWTFKRRDLQPVEMRLFLAKLLEIYPSLTASYAEELQALSAYTSYREALLAWERGEKAVMRAKLAGQFRSLPRAWIFYMLSVLPFGVFPVMERLRRRARSQGSRA